MNDNPKPDSATPVQLIHTALQRLGIALEHTPESRAETRHWLQNDGLDDPNLADLTHLPFVTMDNEDSRDLDQALYIERIKTEGHAERASESKSTGDGAGTDAGTGTGTGEGYRVFYALADASYYIRPGSALFDEALQRGTTYYTPILAAAMLPVELSEGLISLNPDVRRRSLVFDMTTDATGKVTRCHIHRAIIQSRAKLSYEGVQAWLDGHQKPVPPQSYHASLRLLKELGIKLIAASERRGVIRFDRTETSIKLVGSPAQFQATLNTRYDTERYNEQLSLMCNMQGAELLLGLAGVSDVVQAVFRIHEAPLRKNLNRLKDTLDALADAFPDSDQWRWQQEQTLADYVEGLPGDPGNRRRVRAVQRQIMMAQRGSTFTPEPGEHHALKACSYARFSSPMREIVGIFTHKELLEALSGGRFDNDADHALREQIIEAANTSRQRQRQLDKQIEFATLLSLFSAELGNTRAQWHNGTIMGLRADKLYINLDDMALEVKVYRNDLETALSAGYTMDDISARPDTTSAPVWMLGQGVQLRINLYDEARSRFVFDMRDAFNT